MYTENQTQEPWLKSYTEGQHALKSNDRALALMHFKLSRGQVEQERSRSSNDLERDAQTKLLTTIDRLIAYCEGRNFGAASPSSPGNGASPSLAPATAKPAANVFGPSTQAELRNEALIEFVQDLNSLVGMSKFKTRVLNFAKLVKYQVELGEEKPSLHILITGNPGTGKSSMGQILGKFLYGVGYLENNQVITVTEADLCGRHVGVAQEQTKEIFDRARGSVLFVDEVHNLAGGGDNAYGKKVVQGMNYRMETDRGQTVVIAAGYPDETAELLRMEKGLRSRFTDIMEVPDYTPAEMAAITRKFLADAKHSAEPEFYVRAFLVSFMTTLLPTYDPKAEGNARFVRNKIIQGSMRCHACSELSKERSERSRVLRADALPFADIIGLAYPLIDRDQLQWELKRENGEVIQMDADTVGEYFANMTDHRVLDEGQPELTPASKQYLAELVETVN